MGKDVIKEPFAVFNADDFYGQESFVVLADFPKNVTNSSNDYCMVGNHIGITLSESGAVSRVVCSVEKQDYLEQMVDRTHIEEKSDTICYTDEAGIDHPLDFNTLVSMNMWGFAPDYFDYSKDLFKLFIQEHGAELKSEFYIPLAVNTLMENGKIKCKMLDTRSKWFGVTYSEDRLGTVAAIKALIDEGKYPECLFRN